MTNRPWVLYACSLIAILYCSLFAAIYLPETGIVEHGFLFVDVVLLRQVVLCVSLLPSVLVILLLIEIKSTWCKSALFIAVPVSLLSLGYLLFNQVYHHDIAYDLCSQSLGAESTSVGDVNFELRFNEYNTKYADYERGSVLRMQRPVFGNRLCEYKTLLTVDPDMNGRLEVLNSGKTIRYSVPSYQACSPIVREFDSAWDSATNQKCEHIMRR